MCYRGARDAIFSSFCFLQYMPWKKIYHKVRLLDQDITNDICSKLDSFSLKTPNDHGSFSFVVIVNVIK